MNAQTSETKTARGAVGDVSSLVRGSVNSGHFTIHALATYFPKSSLSLLQSDTKDVMAPEGPRGAHADVLLLVCPAPLPLHCLDAGVAMVAQLPSCMLLAGFSRYCNITVSFRRSTPNGYPGSSSCDDCHHSAKRAYNVSSGVPEGTTGAVKSFPFFYHCRRSPSRRACVLPNSELHSPE